MMMMTIIPNSYLPTMVIVQEVVLMDMVRMEFVRNVTNIVLLVMKQNVSTAFITLRDKEEIVFLDVVSDILISGHNVELNVINLVKNATVQLLMIVLHVSLGNI